MYIVYITIILILIKLILHKIICFSLIHCLFFPIIKKKNSRNFYLFKVQTRSKLFSETSDDQNWSWSCGLAKLLLQD